MEAGRCQTYGMRFRTSLLLTSLLTLPINAQSEGELAWYLPSGVTYDTNFPTPEDVLGWSVGTWHVRHDQLVSWFETVEEASPRVSLETYGHTHEDRPLLLATITSPANHARIEEIRKAHVEAVLEGREDHEGPAIVWMGYGVHGNESSASNASLLFAYHLAAARGQDIDRFLENTVVLLDPCVNPDGLSRFAHWANSHRGKNLVADSSHRERDEAWPGGRTNHYWFDLNRDWLLLTHPESRGRIERFHAWLPCVLTDYHEMGSNSTYFFQPGIPSRKNPLTPDENVDLTRSIATFHAAALDELGSLYYTEESFDDFYYGKGSTYPDIHGCIGILFEQASSRGHLQENSFGEISFPFTIRNQLTTSISTLAAVDELRGELTSYQRKFYRDARGEAGRHAVVAYVFGAAQDAHRTAAMADILRRHGIELHRLAADMEGPDGAFPAETSFVVRMEQPQFRLIRALFETRTSWPDNTFYDVSSWTFPLSFDVPYQALEADGWSEDLLGEAVGPETDLTPKGSLGNSRRPVAWMFEWHSYEAPRALDLLLDAGVRARVATRPFRAETSAGLLDFDYGTIVVPTGVQEVESSELRSLMKDITGMGLTVRTASSGLTPGGVDLGSGSLREIPCPEPLLLVGDGVSGYEAGEVWHYLDQRLDMAVAMIERDRLNRLDLDRYTHIIMVSGATGGFGDGEEELLREWVSGGGVLIATKSSAVWCAERLLTNDDEPAEEDEEQEAREGQESLKYADYEDLRGQTRVAGTIFSANLDLTHPLCFGYGREHLAVFRNSTSVLPEGLDPFGTPVRYTPEPLLSGFASQENVERIAGSPAVRAARIGRGSVICMVDNPNFRGVWYGTNKLFANALFFGPALKSTGPLRSSSGREDEAEDHSHIHEDH